MYKILGGDGKEYGPISADNLRQWVNEGRANAQTQVQPEGGAWIALGQLPEFIAILSPPPPGGAGSAPMPGMAGPVSSAEAAQMVLGPAIGLIVTAALGALAQLGGIAFNLFGLSMSQQAGPSKDAAWINMLSGGLGIVFNVIAVLMSIVIFIGAMKMKSLKNYNFALTATIIAMVPCVSPCCWIGLPIGIWAIVMLMKPEVKAAFQANA